MGGGGGGKDMTLIFVCQTQPPWCHVFPPAGVSFQVHCLMLHVLTKSTRLSISAVTFVTTSWLLAGGGGAIPLSSWLFRGHLHDLFGGCDVPTFLPHSPLLPPSPLPPFPPPFSSSPPPSPPPFLPPSSEDSWKICEKDRLVSITMM